MEARIIGLKGSGKTTLISTLAEGRSQGPVTTVHMRDPRVLALAEVYRPKKTTFIEFQVREVAWPERTGRKGEMERYLAALAGGQVFLHVLRAFDNPLLGQAVHPEEDLAHLDAEFMLADFMKVERALERGKKAPLSSVGRRALEHSRELLEGDIPLRENKLDTDEATFLAGYQLLTAVPQIVLVNLEEGSACDLDSLEARAGGRRVIAFPFTEAAEVARLSPDEQLEFAGDLGLPGPPAEVITHAAFEQMGLISFFTVAGDEVRAWPLRQGGTARQAAGTVHSDMERGFIRAEAVPFDVFMRYGSMKASREAGVLRVEGKDYPVAEGEIITVRFNV